MDDLESVLTCLVRVGIVTDVNKKKRKARVKFDDEDLPSGWLRILANPPFIPKVDQPHQMKPWRPLAMWNGPARPGTRYTSGTT